MDPSAFLTRGIELAQLAVDADNRGLKEEAIKFYSGSTEHLRQALILCDDEKLKETIMAKLSEYSGRVAVLCGKQPQLPALGPTSRPPGDFPSISRSLGGPVHLEPSGVPYYIDQESTHRHYNNTMVGATPGPSSSPSTFVAKTSFPSLNPHQLSCIHGETSSARPVSEEEMVSFYVGSKAVLQRALDFAEIAKRTDRQKYYRSALRYYNRALECFMKELEVETNRQIKSSLRDTIRAYMSRAEKLKEFLDANPKYTMPGEAETVKSIIESVAGRGGVPPPRKTQTPEPGGVVHPMLRPSTLYSSSPAILAGSSASAGPPLRSSEESKKLMQDIWQTTLEPSRDVLHPATVDKGEHSHPGGDTAPLKKNAVFGRQDSSSGLLWKKPVSLQMSLEDNVVYPGQSLSLHLEIDNQTKKEVKCVKLTLVQYISTYDKMPGRKDILRRKESVIDEGVFFADGAFPLPGGVPFTGTIDYHVTTNVKPTEISSTGTYSREYELIGELEASLFKNPRVALPITIKA